VRIGSTTTVKAKAFRENWLPSQVASVTYNFQVGEIFILPMGGNYMTPQTVQISAVTPGTEIRYTTNGTEPTDASALYTAPIIIDKNTNLKVKGFISGWAECATVSVNFTFQAQPPVFGTEPGIHSAPISLSISSPTSGAEIRYTTNGTEPAETSALYTAPINITSNTLVKAKAYKTDWNASDVTSGTFSLRAAAPVFSPVPGSFYTAQNVTIACSTQGTAIHYTTNGSTPTSSSPLYTAPVPVTQTTVLKAIAVKAGWSDSNVTTGSYNFQIYAPEFNPAGGQYSGVQTVTIACQTPGVQIRYTTDNTTPSQTSALYTGPIYIQNNVSIRARAFKQGYFDSPVTTASYLFVNAVALPVYSPPPGTYYEQTPVSISCATVGATIRYTLDGTEPNTSSDIYLNPLVLNSNTLIKAKAYYYNWDPSPTAIGSYSVYVPMQMVQVPAGSFVMGDTQGTGFQDAIPTHMVTLNSFLISNFEITQQEWQNVMGYNPSAFAGHIHRPVESVSMLACLVYCNRKSLEEGLTPAYSVNGMTNPDYWGPIPDSSSDEYYDDWHGVVCNWSANGYRLPTEAEWEYAARGGTMNPDFLYSGGNSLNNFGWYASNGSLVTHPVGQKLPNGLGLYDMSGNVREWVWDWYGSTYYSASPTNNPTGPQLAAGYHNRSIRGGSFMDVQTLCLVYARGSMACYQGQMYLGFRIARSY
jgi:formylglycine-generating enzyme required for sulfatase activity